MRNGFLCLKLFFTIAMAPPKKKVANGYKHAEPIPQGLILEDLSKKKWKLGPSIGKGGFGEIYSAQEAETKNSKYPYVLKIEPHSNGPLFVEMHFYVRNAKPEDVDNFKKSKSLKSLGMPIYYGTGSYDYKGEKYRFLVMDKFGTDLWKLFTNNNRVFPTDTVFKLGIQILDVLEYMHSRGYVHADVKGANILLEGSEETKCKQVYLVDFGLAGKFTVEKEFKPNPKKAHDGTIEYLSRDAHQGVQTRRGDLEILAYNLIQWLGCKLPWEKYTDPKVVQKSKEEHMESVSKLIKACFGDNPVPAALTEFLKYLKTLKFDTEPDYKKVRKFFQTGIKDAGGSLDAPLKFSTSKSPRKRKSSVGNNSPKKKKPSRKDRGNLDSDSEDEEVLPKKSPTRKPIAKSKQNDEVISETDEESEVIEEIVPLKRRGRKLKNATEDTLSDSEKPAPRKGRVLKKAVSELALNDTTEVPEGYTEAMKEILKKKKAKELKPKAKNVKEKANEKTLGNSDDVGNLNDGMKEIVEKKNKKVANPKLLSNDLTSNLNSSTEGFTETMREMHLKRKERVQGKSKNNVPVTSSSNNVNSRRGPPRKAAAVNYYNDSDSEE